MIKVSLAEAEEIAEIMCSDYCRYPLDWDAEKEGCELFDSDVCAECPMNKLVTSHETMD